MSTPTLDLALAVLNGAVGGWLSEHDNPLAIEMGLYRNGAPVPAHAWAPPDAGPRAVLLVHGLMGNEHLWAFPDGSDYGSRLARDLGLVPLYLRYNSGRGIADNGDALDGLLERVFTAWPVPLEELVVVAHSMGGLVLRAASHAAFMRGAKWVGAVRRAFYVGTPHDGAPLEQLGRLASFVLRAIPNPYTLLIGHLLDLRSRGIKDLGDPAHPVTLLPSIQHHMIASGLADDPRLALLLGDLMVPVSSATDGQATNVSHLGAPPPRVHVVRGVGHADLVRSEAVYAQLLAWLRA